MCHDVPVSARQRFLAVAATFALATTAGCSISIGDDKDDQPDPVFGTGNTVQWDLTRPLEAEALGLPPDEMVIVDVPENPTVTLTLPTGTWSGPTEEMWVITRHGYVDSVNLYWFEPDGQAAAARMVADAGLFGIDAEGAAAWAETARYLETADIAESDHEENFNGTNGDVSIAVQPDMAVGEGPGTPVQLRYLFYVRDVVETAG